MYDLIIIGAGPAGISMAVEAVNSGINTENILIIEKTHEHSFTIRKYYLDNKIVTANFKGFTPVCTGTMCLTDSSKVETITYLDKAISNSRLNVCYNETVHKIIKEKNNGIFEIETDKKNYKTKIIAIAVGILGKPNKPDYKIPSSLKRKVFFDITTIEIKNSNVLVVGGGDSAAEYSQFLVQENNNITLSYRKNKFTRMNSINKESIDALIKENKIEVQFNSIISNLEDENNKPKVTINNEDKTFDYIVYALGGTTPENFLKTIGIEFNGPDPVLKEGYETNIPGLFLLGDLTAGKKGGSIIWAFNSANTAMAKICNNYLNC